MRLNDFDRAKLTLALALPFLLTPQVLAAPVSGQVPAELKVIWSEGAPDTLRFLPGQALVSPELVSVKSYQGRNAVAAAVASALRSFDRQARRFPACTAPPKDDFITTAPEGRDRSIQELVAAAETAVVGEVTKVIAGWGMPDHRVVSLVEVAVAGVLAKPAGSALAPGHQVTYVQSAGTLRIGPRQACSTNYAGFATFAPGDHLLLIGSMHGPDTSHLSRHYVFPLRDGVLIPQPYFRVERVPLRLDRIQPHAR